MVGVVLVVSGLVAVVYGSWRGYIAARAALAPLAHEGDPTRTLVETTRPLHARTRVRLAVRHVALALLWLAIAMYGLYLLTVGTAVLP